MPSLTIQSPVGALTMTQEGPHLIALSWTNLTESDDTPLLREARSQLSAFFTGRLTKLDLPLAPAGTGFDRRVWEALSLIPFGETRTYADLAGSLGTMPRAIGGACARNPLPIIIPCHRVMAKDGSLGGYSGGAGTATKKYLLDFEYAQARK